jgi:putative heme-binding domain-containing protein
VRQLSRLVTWPGDTFEHPRRPVPKPLTPLEAKRRVVGEAIYNVTCYSCHQAHGRGQPGRVPPLAGSDWVNGPPEHLVRIVLQGLHGPIEVQGETWNLTMPGLGQSLLLNDERLAGVLTYVRRAWGNYGDAVEPDLVAEVRHATAGRTALWTADELLHPEHYVQEPLPQSAKVPPSDPLLLYRSALTGGDRERGRVLFHTNLKVRCLACHKIGRRGGGFVGPDLTEVGGRATRAQLLESILLPSAKIVKGYEAVVIVTTAGRVVSGTVIAQEQGKVVLALPGGDTITLAKEDIQERLESGVSSMPSMGHVFTPREIADLIAYLKSLQPTDLSPGDDE